jgi:hypothetical protein
LLSGVAKKPRLDDWKMGDLQSNCCANAALITVLHGFAGKPLR